MERKFGVNAGDSSAEASVDSYGPLHFGKPFGWSKLLESRRVLLMAEAGAGKTYECLTQADSLFLRGEAAFFLRLETMAANGIRSSLFGAAVIKRFDEWRSSASPRAGKSYVNVRCRSWSGAVPRGRRANATVKPIPKLFFFLGCQSHRVWSAFSRL